MPVHHHHLLQQVATCMQPLSYPSPIASQVETQAEYPLVKMRNLTFSPRKYFQGLQTLSISWEPSCIIFSLIVPKTSVKTAFKSLASWCAKNTSPGLQIKMDANVAHLKLNTSAYWHGQQCRREVTYTILCFQIGHRGRFVQSLHNSLAVLYTWLLGWGVFKYRAYLKKKFEYFFKTFPLYTSIPCICFQWYSASPLPLRQKLKVPLH